MSEIPTGPVTFLFTDIEGSTRLSQEFPESLPAALEKHHSILTRAIQSNNGFIFEIVGDAFCSAFQNSEDALKAAIDAQLKLSKEKCLPEQAGDDAVIKVRMGIHSGSVEWNGKTYMGYITLAQTARVMSAAYGEQIIISKDTYESLNVTNQEIRNENNTSRSQSPDWEWKQNEISFRDLGERRMRDVIQPIRLYQVLVKGLRENFPPLKTLDARPNNLPVQLTSFIGREEEMKQIKSLLKQTHLLTLTGPGGAGKTRLSLQVAADMIDDFANGVWFVELAALPEAELLPHTVIKALGAMEQPKQEIEDTLVDFLKDKELLLIFDNCEHLIGPVTELTEKLLSKAPKIKILATSREVLRCSGELTYGVLSLETPDPKENESPEKLSKYGSVRLFIERALAVNSSFRVNNSNAPVLAEICYQLDGIPLAIELAAARIKVLSVEQICSRLNKRFELLTGGKRNSLPRQKTLRALIDWSYDLLPEKEKLLWTRLSVFSGGWTLEAAEEICPDEKISKHEIMDLMESLAEKSIIKPDQSSERFNMLETIKHYGKEKLPDLKKILHKHLNYFMKFSETAEPRLSGDGLMHWLDRIEAEHYNLQFAIRFSIDDGDIEEGIRITSAISHYWNIRGYHYIGREIIEDIIKSPRKITSALKAKLFNAAGSIFRGQGDFEQAKDFAERSLTLYRELKDKNGMARSLNTLSKITRDVGDYEQSKTFALESLALNRDTGNKYGIATSVNNLGNAESDLGDHVKAKELYEESLAIEREIGNKYAIAISLSNLGNEARTMGDHKLARKFYEESLLIRLEIQDKPGTADSYLTIGNEEFEMGNHEEAKIFYEKSMLLFKEIGEKRGIAFTLNNLGVVENDLENYEQAKKYYEESLQMKREAGAKTGIAISLLNLGVVSGKLKDFVMEKKYHKESLAQSMEIRNNVGIIDSLVYAIGILAAEKKFHPAAKIAGALENAMASGKFLLDEEKQKLKDELNKTLKENLSQEDFMKFSEEGRKMNITKAGEMALGEM